MANSEPRRWGVLAGLLCREGTGQLGTHQVTSPSRARLHTHSSLPFAQVHECHAHPGVWRLKKKNARVPFQCTCSRDAVGTGSEDLRAEMVSFPVPFRAQISEDSVLETTEGRFWRRQIQNLFVRPKSSTPLKIRASFNIGSGDLARHLGNAGPWGLQRPPAPGCAVAHSR